MFRAQSWLDLVWYPELPNRVIIANKWTPGIEPEHSAQKISKTIIDRK